MNRVLWLQEQKGTSSAKHSAAVSYQNKNGNTGCEVLEKIFISLPKRPPETPPALSADCISLSVAVVFPKHYNPTTKQCTHPKERRTQKRRISAVLISLFSLIAMVFTAIGMLNLMISSLSLQAYSPGYYRMEEAVHKPGSGPAPQDAVLNEYQHALVREMIPAVDSNAKKESRGKNYKVNEKGILPLIRISSDKETIHDKNGISHWQLKVFNGTTNVLDKITIQVDFLSKTGHLLRSENYSADNIAPLELKFIDLPQGMPDMSIRCYIQEVRTKALRTTLRSL